MKRFNLSGWAVSHPALILFLVIALGAAGFFSYQRLGRADHQRRCDLNDIDPARDDGRLLEIHPATDP